MNLSELEASRIKLIRDAHEFKKIDRIPNASLFQQWRVFDAGYTLTQALSDYDIMEKVVREHQEKYNFDLFIDTGARNPYLLYQALGSTSYDIDDENGYMNHVDFAYCEHDELREFASDYWKFLWEKAMYRKFKFWRDEFDVDIFQNALEKRDMHFAFAAKMSKILKEEYAIPASVAPNPFAPMSIEAIYSYPRGIKGMSLDMRRDPGAFDALMDTYNEMFYYPVLEKMKAIPAGKNMSACYDTGMTFLCQNILNNKQWEKYYWPYLKQNFDIAAQKDLSVFVFVEGAILRFADCFKDYKKGILGFMLENDDVFEFRKTLPNCAIMGGMDNTLLWNGTQQDCINLAEKLINDLNAFEGGYMLTETKIGAFKNDAKAQNLKAVCDFVSNYTRSQN